MGYCMEQHEAKFFIVKDNFAAALAAIHELCTHEELMVGGSWDRTGRTSANFSWVDMDELRTAKTLVEALRCWRWEPEEDKGNISGINFEGEKLGQEELLFEAIAPWVREGSYIEMVGEDGAMWRWVFRGGKCREITATITWEE